LTSTFNGVLLMRLCSGHIHISAIVQHEMCQMN
jgi:hypothetical protein